MYLLNDSTSEYKLNRNVMIGMEFFGWKQKSTLPGLEPGIFGFGDQRRIHLAIAPHPFSGIIYHHIYEHDCKLAFTVNARVYVACYVKYKWLY